MGVGVVLGGEREERAGGWEVVGVVIGGYLVVDLGEGGDVVLGGGGENGGGCDLGSKKVGDGDSYS